MNNIDGRGDQDMIPYKEISEGDQRVDQEGRHTNLSSSHRQIIHLKRNASKFEINTNNKFNQKIANADLDELQEPQLPNQGGHGLYDLRLERKRKAVMSTSTANGFTTKDDPKMPQISQRRIQMKQNL